MKSDRFEDYLRKNNRLGSKPGIDKSYSNIVKILYAASRCKLAKDLDGLLTLSPPFDLAEEAEQEKEALVGPDQPAIGIGQLFLKPF